MDFGHLASWFPRSSGFYLFTFSRSCFGAASDSYVADISILCRALLLLLLVLLNPAPPFTITKLRLSQLLGYESTEALSFSDGNALPRLHCMIFRVAFNLRASGFLWEKRKGGRNASVPPFHLADDSCCARRGYWMLPIYFQSHIYFARHWEFPRIPSRTSR